MATYKGGREDKKRRTPKPRPPKNNLIPPRTRPPKKNDLIPPRTRPGRPRPDVGTMPVKPKPKKRNVQPITRPIRNQRPGRPRPPVKRQPRSGR